MRHAHHGEGGRHSHHHHPFFHGHEGHHSHEGHHRGGPHGRSRGARMFDYGDLRLLILAMLVERPRHGYELIKDIEERLGGSYSPSPGVIYPTLSWLDEIGYAALDAEEGGRKRYRATPEGEAHLEANRAAVDALLARLSAVGAAGHGRPEHAPAPVQRAVENLKMALRLRFTRGPIDQAAAEAIAAAIDAAAQTVERS